MESDNKNRTIIYILVTAVVVLLGLIGYFLFFRPNSSNNSNNNTTPTPTASVSPTSTDTPTVTTTTTLTPTSTTSVTPSTTITSTPSVTGTLPAQVQVRIPYSVADDPNDSADKNSVNSFGYYEYRIYRTNRADTENYVIEKVIEGPTQADKDTLYWYTPIVLTGDSNCGGNNFVLTKDTSANSITVQFCKNLTLGGVGDSARVNTVIKAGITENKFLSADSPSKIIVLDRNGNCVGDESGLNRCKN
jgi:hypothetical protein